MVFVHCEHGVPVAEKLPLHPILGLFQGPVGILKWIAVFFRWNVCQLICNHHNKFLDKSKCFRRF